MVVRGAVDDEAFSFCYFKDGALIAIDSINAPQDHMAGRKLIGHPSHSITPAQAADKAFELRSALN
jgi:3-phenylpropionate/trans-cinnamate dioxygenase ferredoxin reductase subunit